MSAVQMSFRGGERLRAYLAAAQSSAASARSVRVGFLEGATYPATQGANGRPRPRLNVAQVAFWNEFGTLRAPARPFFRQTIARESPGWGGKLGKFLRASHLDTGVALRALGTDVKDAIVQTIDAWPADNAPSTARRKGFNHGLVHTAHMMRSVDFEVLR